MILNPGHPNQFALGFTLPTDAPPSIDLHDNEINRSVDLRIDIPAGQIGTSRCQFKSIRNSKLASATRAVGSDSDFTQVR